LQQRSRRLYDPGRIVLGGALAVPCNPQAASSGAEFPPEGWTSTESIPRVAVMVRSQSDAGP